MKPNTHLDEEQFVNVYYGELDATAHLEVCSECRAQLERLREMLDGLRGYSGPERDAGYGSAVWTRLQPRLPASRPTRKWIRWWTWTPVFAALLIVGFITGRLTEQNAHQQGISEKARERILLISLSDHLERSQVVLANVENASAGSADLGYERDRAHELLGANRLLRETAVRLGDYTDAALLDDLERGLLSIANTPLHSSPAALEQVQQWIENDGLLFKVRVASSASRERGQSL
jgi:hypothetical protein